LRALALPAPNRRRGCSGCTSLAANLLIALENLDGVASLAEECVGRFEGDPSLGSAYQFASTMLGRAGRFQRAIELAEEAIMCLVEKPELSSAYSNAIALMSRISDADRAYATAERAMAAFAGTVKEV